MWNFYRFKDTGPEAEARGLRGMIFRLIEERDGYIFADAPGTQAGWEGTREQFNERFVQMSLDEVAATPLCHLNEPLPCCRLGGRIR